MSERTQLTDVCLPGLQDFLRPDLFKALCDPTRLALVARIASAGRPLTVTEASECCGVHLSGASRHLTKLRKAGVLIATKVGREVTYQVDVSGVVGVLRGLADALERCCAPQGCCAPSGATDSTTCNPPEGEGEQTI